jgi:hypothetical protein
MVNRKSEFATFLRPEDITEPIQLTIVSIEETALSRFSTTEAG